jgi:hypothetical protein
LLRAGTFGAFTLIEPAARNGDAFSTGAEMRVPPPRRWRQALRVLAAVLVVVTLAIAMSGIGLFFLLRGDAVESSFFTKQIEASIQKILGPRLAVELGPTSIGFDPEGLLTLESSDVTIRRSSDRQIVSQLGRVLVGIKPLSLAYGEPSVDAVIIENSDLDASFVPLAFGQQPQPGIEGMLLALRQSLDRARGEFESGRFRLLQFRNVTIEGLGLGRPDAGSVALEKLDLRYRRKRDALTLDARLITPQSTITFESAYEPQASGGRVFKARLSGLNAREWAADPDGETGLVGSDALINLSGDFPFAADGVPQPAGLRLDTLASSLRFGLEAVTDLHELNLDLRLRPAENDILVGRSTILAGAFRAEFGGSLRTQEGGSWLKGPYAFDLSAAPATRAPTQNGEPSIAGALQFAGTFDASTRVLSIDNSLFQAGADTATGSAIFDFNGATPSISAAYRADGLEVAVVKQFWPFFIAPGARSWAHRSVLGGRLSDVTLEASVPHGIIGRFRKGAKMKPEEFKLQAGFSGVTLNAFGELPPVEQASGKFAMVGMTVDAAIDSGTSATEQFGPVALTSGTFRIDDIGVRPNIGQLQIRTKGPAKPIAAIAESRPLSVLSRINLTVDGVAGDAEVDVRAVFPIKRGLVYSDVEWEAVTDLRKASTTDKLFDRTVAGADVRVEANPRQVAVKGNAVIDGMKTKIEMLEPIGDSGIARERAISAVLDEAARKKMGLVLDPVLTGTIGVDVTQKKDGVEKQSVDLTRATLDLPWVGWTKGKGIPARATFVMRSDKGITELDDFYIEGTGFSAVGKLRIDKTGLLLADFVNISLNDGDAFAMRLERKGKNYKITVSGLRYDARALINRLFHEEGIGDEQGDSTLLVTANFAEVRGHNGRVLRNVEMSYGARNGWLDHLSMRGAFSDSGYVSVFAATTDGKTTFEIDSTDAGGTLAFVNVYPRMYGGKMRARLTRTGDGPFVGPVGATDFVIVDEPRLKSLVKEPVLPGESGQGGANLQRELGRIDTNRVRFQEARGRIEKGTGYFRVNDGVINNAQIGFTFDGLVYDADSKMELSGTFLPAIGLGRAIGFIPLVGEILGDGRETGLIGVTYRLRGPSSNPNIEINPVSMVAPGVFRRIFEFQKD